MVVRPQGSKYFPNRILARVLSKRYCYTEPTALPLLPRHIKRRPKFQIILILSSKVKYRLVTYLQRFIAFASSRAILGVQKRFEPPDMLATKKKEEEEVLSSTVPLKKPSNYSNVLKKEPLKSLSKCMKGARQSAATPDPFFFTYLT